MKSNICSLVSNPKFFGRRQGRTVRKAKMFLLDKMLPKMRVSEAKDFDKTNVFFANKENVCLEIGFGDGQHLYGVAKNNPCNAYIGVEVFRNGVANLLSLISGIKEGDNLPEDVNCSDYEVQNVRVFEDDVRLLFSNIPDEFFDRVFLLFPDPWPKKKHADRRFINPDNLRELYRILKVGGRLLVATDHPVYKRHVLRCMHKFGGFLWTAKCGEDWRKEPDDWVKTKYQLKAIREGRRPVWFDYKKI